MLELAHLSQSGSEMGDVLVSSFGLFNKFNVLHLIVHSTNPKVGCSYTVTYSSGARQVDLQDGLIVDYTLSPDKETSFYYSTLNPGHAYLSISMESASDLSKLDVKMKHCDDAEKAKTDDDCWKSFSAEKPPIKKKTPNPTIMYSLPAER